MGNNEAAELTVLYKNCPITRLLFENTEVAEMFANGLMALLDEGAKKDCSFKAEVKQVYMAETVVGQLRDGSSGKIKPESTVLDLMKKIDELV